MTADLVYLDYNATTPLDPRVAAAMEPFLRTGWGNPSSTHQLGREARAAVDRARAAVAGCLGAETDEIVFTSGGTEANNLAIRGVVEAAGHGHVVTSAVEHPAVAEVLRALEREGRIRVTRVRVDRFGRVSPEAVAEALADDTVLVSVMLAQNEVGTLMPLAEIARLCHERPRPILVHTDAAQAVGKVGVDVRSLGVDLLSVAGHKLYGPKGVGALFVRRGVLLEPVLRGAGHERGLRPGTENVLGLVGLGRACELASTFFEEEGRRLLALKDRLRAALSAVFEGLVVHGDPATGLPNTLSVALPGVLAGPLLERLGDRLAASAGAACHGGASTPSSVLTAMGVEPALALSTLRLSLGRPTTAAEVDRAAALLHEAAA